MTALPPPPSPDVRSQSPHASTYFVALPKEVDLFAEDPQVPVSVEKPKIPKFIREKDAQVVSLTQGLLTSSSYIQALIGFQKHTPQNVFQDRDVQVIEVDDLTSDLILRLQGLMHEAQTSDFKAQFFENEEVLQLCDQFRADFFSKALSSAGPTGLSQLLDTYKTMTFTLEPEELTLNQRDELAATYGIAPEEVTLTAHTIQYPVLDSDLTTAYAVSTQDLPNLQKMLEVFGDRLEQIELPFEALMEGFSIAAQDPKILNLFISVFKAQLSAVASKFIVEPLLREAFVASISSKEVKASYEIETAALTELFNEYSTNLQELNFFITIFGKSGLNCLDQIPTGDMRMAFIGATGNPKILESLIQNFEARLSEIDASQLNLLLSQSSRNPQAFNLLLNSFSERLSEITPQTVRNTLVNLLDNSRLFTTVLNKFASQLANFSDQDISQVLMRAFSNPISKSLLIKIFGPEGLGKTFIISTNDLENALALRAQDTMDLKKFLVTFGPEGENILHSIPKAKVLEIYAQNAGQPKVQSLLNQYFIEQLKSDNNGAHLADLFSDSCDTLEDLEQFIAAYGPDGTNQLNSLKYEDIEFALVMLDEPEAIDLLKKAFIGHRSYHKLFN